MMESTPMKSDVTETGDNAEDTVNVLMAGVGGQGIITASAVLAQAALEAGYDVKKSEIHGMSQRGGSVESHVRLRRGRVHSPIIPWGRADLTVGLEMLEALRSAHWVRPGGTMLVDDRKIHPSTIASGAFEYPQDCLERLAKHDFELIVVNAFTIAVELGEYRAANTVMLGAMSQLLPIPAEAWQSAMWRIIKPRGLQVNLEAFAAGQGQVYSCQNH
jgi:indolepyruvate ferredoxin oxidoreductase beta subunit